MNVHFNVRSNRLRNMFVPEGTTVGKFKQHLDEVGYDVRDALVYVLTDAGCKTGDLANYRLAEDDVCIFDTAEVIGFIDHGAKPQDDVLAGKDPNWEPIPGTEGHCTIRHYPNGDVGIVDAKGCSCRVQKIGCHNRIHIDIL